MKAFSPIEVTLSGILMLVNPLHPANADMPMDVIELGIVVFIHPEINKLDAVSMIALQESRESKTSLPFSTLICKRVEQLLYALRPILLIELGITNDVIFEPFAKSEGIVLTFSPIVILSILLAGMLPLVLQLLAFQERSVILVHPKKDPSVLISSYSSISVFVI